MSRLEPPTLDLFAELPAGAALDTPEKEDDAFRTISETAELLGVPAHVLRFWESQFPTVHPLKRSGGRRYYRPQDIDTLQAIKQLLYKEGYTIKGARRALQQQLRERKEAAPRKKNRRPAMQETPLLRGLEPVAAAPAPASASTDKHKALLDIRAELVRIKATLAESAEA